MYLVIDIKNTNITGIRTVWSGGGPCGLKQFSYLFLWGPLDIWGSMFLKFIMAKLVVKVWGSS